ncbi:MAG: shikimate kinase, partial [Deltaproteobacteria bacterium]|nr:shikimate kinase [Deltaproteobacteria bacterium]
MRNPVTTRGAVLVGFMGAGKSSVGKELARRLGAEFIDVDDRV